MSVGHVETLAGVPTDIEIGTICEHEEPICEHEKETSSITKHWHDEFTKLSGCFELIKKINIFSVGMGLGGGFFGYILSALITNSNGSLSSSMLGGSVGGFYLGIFKCLIDRMAF